MTLGRGAGLRLVGAFLALLLLNACGGGRQGIVSHVKPVPPQVLVRTAKSQIGAPYRYGGKDPKTGFDCSGLVWWSYHKYGSNMPRTAQQQYKHGTEISKGDLEPGDLLYFDIGGKKPAHVAIFTGRGRFVHAPSTGGRVREDELSNNYWKRVYYGARRIE
jgi:murein DD-endopeptidase